MEYTNIRFRQMNLIEINDALLAVIEKELDQKESSELASTQSPNNDDK